MIFDWKNGLIWISINIEYEGKNTKINNCILDTGSATTAIDIDLVDFNFQKFAVIKRLHGIGDAFKKSFLKKLKNSKLSKLNLKILKLTLGSMGSLVMIS